MQEWFVAHYVVLKDFSGPALTVVGFAITVTLAIVSFRTFDKWKQEKIEENRIDVALKTLAIAFESVIILDEIRAPLRHEYEWDKMPKTGESEDRRRRKGSHWAVLKRMDDRKEYFDRVWAVQPTFMAVFGPETEKIFEKLHRARNRVAASAGALIDEVGIEHDPANQDIRNYLKQLRIDTSCSQGQSGREGDEVGKMVVEFRSEIEALARPVIDRRFGRKKRRGLLDWLKDLFSRKKEKAP